MNYKDNFDIVIGIPALNEEETIKKIVEVFDASLQKYFPNKKTVLILLDSNSKDKTVEFFNNTKTVVQKIVIRNLKKGKGRNIINLLKFSIKNNVKCVCMVDADIKNVNISWLYKFINPIINNEADFILPIYKRGKFSGNITNLICRPVLYGLYGTFITQPIGGDFSFNSNYAIFILNKIKSVKQNMRHIVNSFGIDIFMTYYCLVGKYKYKEVDLGEKLDKPGFFHMDQIFEEVCLTLFYLISENSIINIEKQPIKYIEFIKDAKPYTDVDLLERKKAALSLRDNFKKNNLNIYLYNKLDIKSLEEKDLIKSDDFDNLIVKIIRLLQSDGNLRNIRLIEIIKTIRPYFHLRVYSYFKDIENKEPKEVEGMLLRSCKFMRKKILNT